MCKRYSYVGKNRDFTLHVTNCVFSNVLMEHARAKISRNQ